MVFRIIYKKEKKRHTYFLFIMIYERYEKSFYFIYNIMKARKKRYISIKRKIVC